MTVVVRGDAVVLRGRRLDRAARERTLRDAEAIADAW